MPDSPLSPPDDAKPPRFEAPARDPLLFALVGLVNTGGEPGDNVVMGMTLQIGGCVITGDLIGLPEYFELAADGWDASTAGRPAGSGENLIAQGYREAATEFRKNHGTFETAPVWEFVHMKNARYLIGPQMISGNGMFWRGRLRDVEAFSRGKMEPNRL